MTLLLSICVPTYNRPADLNKRLAEFLLPAATKHLSKVEVIIRDNSDDDTAIKQNRLNSVSPVRYTHNGSNLGFFGNYHILFSDAEGEFVWVVSDNDELNILTLPDLLRQLQVLSLASEVAGMTVSYEERNVFGEYIKSDGTGEVPQTRSTILRKLAGWDSSHLPFTLFSSIIVRRNIAALQSWREPPGITDYMHIAFLAHLIGADGGVWRSQITAIKYKTEKSARYGLKAIFHAHLATTDALALIIKRPVRKARAGEWLYYCVQDYVGYKTFRHAKNDRWWFIFRGLRSPTAAGVCYVILLLSPRIMAQWIYAVTISLRQRPRGCTFREGFRTVLKACS